MRDPACRVSAVPIGRFEWERLIRENSTLSRSEKLVAFVCASFANLDGGGIYPGNQQLAHSASMGLATAKRNRDAVAAAGWLTKVSHGNRHRKRADEWQLTMPELVSVPAVPGVSTEPTPLTAPETVIVPPVANDAGILTPVERARRRVAEALGEFVSGSPAWEQRRAELAGELQNRVMPAEAREVLGYSEIEYRAVMKRRGRAG